ncbi:MAG: 30S ribosomal protein S3 [Promethearchaeota archaeon]
MPSIKRVFCEKAIHQMTLKEFFKKQLDGVGFSDLDIQKTPLGTRVTIRAARPGLVIGKKGSNVKKLTEVLATDFNIENPQIDVEEVTTPELNAQIMAERLASALEKGQHYRRAGYGLLRRIIRSGALGAEIIISGKITSQRARYQKMSQGIIIKCGEPVRDLSYGVAHAKLKLGILGIRVKILPPDHDNPKEIKYIGKDGLDPELRERLQEFKKDIVEEPVVEEKDDGVVKEVDVDVEIPGKATDKIKGVINEDEDLLSDDDEIVLAEDAPGEETPDDELQEALKEDAPVEDAPVEETPDEELQEALKEDEPVDGVEAPGEGGEEEEKKPAEEAPKKKRGRKKKSK